MSRLLASLILLAPVLAACGGSAVPVRTTESGGVFAIEGDHVQAMADARRQMSERCGGAYTIVQQRNAVTAVLRGRTITEFLVEYVCGPGMDRPAAPASSGTPSP